MAEEEGDKEEDAMHKNQYVVRLATAFGGGVGSFRIRLARVHRCCCEGAKAGVDAKCRREVNGLRHSLMGRPAMALLSTLLTRSLEPTWARLLSIASGP